MPLSRLVCTPRLKGTKAGGTKAAASAAEAIKQAPEFGTKVASEDSAAQLMHDAQKGKFAYINDFAASLNTGPVKLSFKDAPRTKEDEAQQDRGQRVKTLLDSGELNKGQPDASPLLTEVVVQANCASSDVAATKLGTEGGRDVHLMMHHSRDTAVQH